MTTLPAQLESYTVFEQDLPESVFRQIVAARRVAWDIETTGLAWAENQIRLCQLHYESAPVAIVRVSPEPPRRLTALLADHAIQKVFHHAMFDLRFMAHHWRATPRNLACTKIAAKLLFPHDEGAQHLQSLLHRYLGTAVDKTEQTSNWSASTLTRAQLSYAARDVVYLFDLLHALLAELERSGRRSLVERCFAHLPTRVELDVGGFGDVFTY